jgi:hypothetical protein
MIAAKGVHAQFVLLRDRALVKNPHFAGNADQWGDSTLTDDMSDTSKKIMPATASKSTQSTMAKVASQSAPGFLNIAL